MIQYQAAKSLNFTNDLKNSLLKETQSTMKEKENDMKKINITEIISKCLFPSLLIEANLIASTRAYPFISLGTRPANLNPTLFAWEAVISC